MIDIFFIIAFIVIGLTAIFIIYNIYLIIVEFIKYFNIKDKGNEIEEEMLNDKNRLHRTIVFFMCDILRTDDNDILYQKLTIISRYINNNIQDPHEKKIAYQMLNDLTQKKSITKKDKNSENRVNKDTKNLIDKLSKTEFDSSFKIKEDEISYNSLPFKNEIHILTVAQKLSTKLDKIQKLYITYLLVKLANVDNNINDSETEHLQKICVTGLGVEQLKFNELIHSKNYEIWYKNNILTEESPNNFPKIGTIGDIFSKVNYFSKINTSLNEFTSQLKPIHKLILYGSFSSIILSIIMLLGTNLWSAVTISVMLFLFSIFTIGLVTYVENNKKLPYSENYGIIRTEKETKYQINGIIVCLGLILILNTLLWGIVTSIFYNFGNSKYGSYEKIVTATITDKYVTKQKSSKTYYIQFSQPTIPQEWEYPEISENNKKCLDLIEKITYQYLLKESKEINIPEATSIDTQTYNKAEIGNTIKIKLKQGYYNTIIENGYEI
ncbi:MAG: hypothetical protein MJ211_11810 [Bacteroidales bacterium]|nr:hypothetical protein [Bacteroidales bacterium]